MNITTSYKTNAQGRSQIVAKGNGRQRTVSFDPAKSSDWNHGNAAGELVLANAHQAITEWHISRERVESATHTANDSGTVHRFSL